MTSFPEPCSDNYFPEHHIGIPRASLRHWTGQDLVESHMDNRKAAQYLYNAAFALLSDDAGTNPMFNHTHRTGQKLFEMN